MFSKIILELDKNSSKIFIHNGCISLNSTGRGALYEGLHAD